MTIDEFWELIETAGQQSQGDMECKCAFVQKAVAAMPPDAAIAFSKYFDESMNRAYTWGLWGAAYVVNGGCGDDTFSDFRASLISRGKKAFESAIADPDSLADEAFDEEVWFYEGFQYAVHEGAEAAISPEKLTVSAIPNEPSGTAWEEEPDVLKVLFPKLWKKFGHIWSLPNEPAASKPRPWWKLW
ncbi:MAG: DUF4240 domain-containing protein [Desulfobacterales bacterium]|nr:DUF4240 domain-containing protein [Desulfobacterales bacterium]